MLHVEQYELQRGGPEMGTTTGPAGRTIQRSQRKSDASTLSKLRHGMRR